MYFEVNALTSKYFAAHKMKKMIRKIFRNFNRFKLRDISRQTKIFMYSKNRIFRKNPVFLKIL